MTGAMDGGDRPDCDQPGCDGKIDETGFCDTCGLRPRPEAEPTVPTTRSIPTSSVSDPQSLPVFPFPGPYDRIISRPNIPDHERRCPRCGHPVGRPYKGQPGLDQGFCSHCATPYSFRPGLRAGDLVGDQYEVVGCFARGGIGFVYLAKDKHLDDNPVVLKGLIDTSDAALAVAERRALTTLNHPNIVRIFNFVSHPDQHTGQDRDYIVMEYVDGLTLWDVRNRSLKGGTPLGEPFLVEHVIACGLQILAALEYLHGRQVLYCDMKPDNVIVRSGQHGETVDRVKVIDLGAVRGFDDRGGKIIGASGYQVADDEIRDRGLTVRSDIHTMGRTLRALYEGTVDWPARRRRGNPLGVGLDSFSQVVDRATGPYEHRFASAAEMADQLRGVRRRIASLRDRRPRPEPSTVFGPTAALLDAGLGVVPPLDHWVDGVRPLDGPAAMPAGTPEPSAVATGLPVPYVDPADPQAGFLADVDATDPRGLLGKLATVDTSFEIELTRCRAHLELGNVAEAARDLESARATHQDGWRLRWHDGLLALARGDIEAAQAHFDEVQAALPGEDAPMLARAYCLEALGDKDAEKYYHAVWQRDRTQASAAFGLARLALAGGKRRKAIDELSAVPMVSRHAAAAAIAQVLVLSHPVGADQPSTGDLTEAARRLPHLHLDSGDRGGHARDRLTTVVREAVLCRLGDNGAQLLADGGDVFGADPDETATRRLLEQSYQALARQASDADAHGVLVDRANAIRPSTFL